MRIANNGELICQYWKLTTGSDGSCRLYNNTGTDYYNFWAKALNSNTSLSVGTTANITGNLTCSSNVGIGTIGNTTPWVPLNIGNSSVSGSDGYIVLSKNSSITSGNRNFRMDYNVDFFFCMGDSGNANNNSNNWTPQIAAYYSAP
jgi:hypothetical protein